jgi:hypothetical protein
MPLLDENGERICGKENKESAEVALAKERLNWADDGDASSFGNGQLLVARVYSENVQYCQKDLLKGQISERHRDNSVPG